MRELFGSKGIWGWYSDISSTEALPMEIGLWQDKA